MSEYRTERGRQGDRNELRSGRIRVGGPLEGKDINLPAVVDFDVNGMPRFHPVGAYDLSRNFMQAFLKAHAGVAQSEEAGSTERSLAAPDAERSEEADVNSTWIDLGAKLDFVPLLNDLAVIVADPTVSTYGEVASVLERVERLVGALETNGHEHAAVAVVSAGLPHSLTDKLFEAGSFVLDVGAEFFALDESDRLKLLRSMVPTGQVDPLLSAVVAQNPEANPDDYDARNPDLSDDEMNDWLERLGSPNASA